MGLVTDILYIVKDEGVIWLKRLILSARIGRGEKMKR
jgi:hypothetical protein